MVVGGYRHVPILDASGRPRAILSVGDVVYQLKEVFAEAETPDTLVATDTEWVDSGGGG
jgi:hypothetical protein